jgi:hypothetical protein
VGAIRRLLVLVGSLIVGYVISVFLYAVADSISKMPKGPLWDSSFQTSFRFIMLIIAFVVVLSPAFRSQHTPAVRTASILTVLVFVVYIGLKLGGVGHPDFPVMWVLAHLEPLRRMLENMSKQPH